MRYIVPQKNKPQTPPEPLVLKGNLPQLGVKVPRWKYTVAVRDRLWPAPVSSGVDMYISNTWQAQGLNSALCPRTPQQHDDSRLQLPRSALHLHQEAIKDGSIGIPGTLAGMVWVKYGRAVARICKKNRHLPV